MCHTYFVLLPKIKTETNDGKEKKERKRKKNKSRHPYKTDFYSPYINEYMRCCALASARSTDRPTEGTQNYKLQENGGDSFCCCCCTSW